MKKTVHHNWQQWSLYLLLLWLGLAFYPPISPSHRSIHTLPSPRAILVSPQPTSDTYVLPPDVQAYQLYDFFLYQHRNIHETFPRSLYFHPANPENIFGFYDTAVTPPEYYTLAVFARPQDAQADGTTLTQGHDTVLLEHRCMLIGEIGHTTQIHVYSILLNAVCLN